MWLDPDDPNTRHDRVSDVAQSYHVVHQPQASQAHHEGEQNQGSQRVPHTGCWDRQDPTYHAVLTGQLAFAVGIPLGSAQSGRSPHPAFRPTTFGQSIISNGNAKKGWTYVPAATATRR
jgi:hypothetical protein